MQIPQFIWRIIGKKVVDKVGGEEKWEASKTKLTAIVAVLITAVQVLGPAFGHPIVIPDWVYQFLAGIGLWALKDGAKS